MRILLPLVAIGALGAMRDRPDSTPDLPDLAVPTLVIHGVDDPLIPVEAGANAKITFRLEPR